MIIEVNGIKMEVDERYAKRVEEFHIGGKVKVLKKGYGNDYKVYHGVIVGFEPFECLPTIIVCYLDVSFNEAKLEFLHFNSKSSREEIDIVASTDDDLPCDKQDVLNRLDKEVEKHLQSIEDLNRKRDYFLKHFDLYFERSTMS